MAFDDVARPHELLRVAARADTGGGTGGDDVAGAVSAPARPVSRPGARAWPRAVPGPWTGTERMRWVRCGLLLSWLAATGTAVAAPQPLQFDTDHSRFGFEIRTREPMPVNADGEIVTQTPAVFRVRPGAIRVFVP